jgi:hypothetical protein
MPSGPPPRVLRVAARCRTSLRARVPGSRRPSGSHPAVTRAREPSAGDEGPHPRTQFHISPLVRDDAADRDVHLQPFVALLAPTAKIHAESPAGALCTPTGGLLPSKSNQPHVPDSTLVPVGQLNFFPKPPITGSPNAVPVTTVDSVRPARPCSLAGPCGPGCPWSPCWPVGACCVQTTGVSLVLQVAPPPTSITRNAPLDCL